MLHIAFTADEKFSYPLQIAIYSLVKHLTKPATIDVISADLSDNSKKLIQKTIEKINPLVALEFHQFDHNLVKDFPLTVAGISLAGYYRLFLSEILSYDKVLYLDCDILVTKDISELSTINLENSYCAGVLDGNLNKKEYVKDQGWEELIPNYINSGVMLLNLDLIRQENILNSYFQSFIKHKDKIFFQDQDIINLTLNQRKIYPLPTIYNWQPFHDHDESFRFFPLSKLFSYHLPKLLHNSSLSHVAIFHFAGSKKPWVKNKFRSYAKDLYSNIMQEYKTFLES